MSFVEVLDEEIAGLAATVSYLNAIMRGLDKIPKTSDGTLRVTSKLKKSYRELLSALQHLKSASDIAKQTPEISSVVLGEDALFLLPAVNGGVTSLAHYAAGPQVSSVLIRTDRAVAVLVDKEMNSIHHLLRNDGGFFDCAVGVQPLLLPFMVEDGCSIRVDAQPTSSLPAAIVANGSDKPAREAPSSSVSAADRPIISSGFTTCAIAALATKLLRAKEADKNDVRVAVFAARRSKWPNIRQLIQCIPADAINCICTSRYAAEAADGSGVGRKGHAKGHGGDSESNLGEGTLGTLMGATTMEDDVSEMALMQAGFVPRLSTVNITKTHPSSPQITAGVKPTLVVCTTDDVFDGHIDVTRVDHLIVDDVAVHDDIAALGPFYRLRDIVTRGRQGDCSELISPKGSDVLVRLWSFQRYVRVVVASSVANVDRELRLLVGSLPRDAFKIVCSPQSRLHIEGATVIPNIGTLPNDVDQLIICDTPTDPEKIKELLAKAAAHVVTFLCVPSYPISTLERAVKAEKIPFTTYYKDTG